MANKFLKQYEILFKKAKVDLNTAKIVLHSFEQSEIELDLDVVMFHLQQSAEKLLKTLLDFNNIQFPRSHDIEELINLLEFNNIKLIDNVNFFISLTSFAVESRYDMILDDLNDAYQYIVELESFVDFTKKIIETKEK